MVALNPSAKAMVLRLEHWKNARFPIVLRLAGKVREVTPVCWKALFPMVGLEPSAKVMVSRAVEKLKAADPMVLRLAGKVREVMPDRWKALRPSVTS